MERPTLAPINAPALYLARIGSALAWQHIRGSRSIWQLICEAVSKLDGPTLVDFATTCNCEIDTAEGELDHERQRQIVGRLSSEQQLQDFDAVVKNLRAKEGWGVGKTPPVLHRQMLLVLMRLAFQYARWDGSGEPVTGPQVLNLALRINDHLDGLPDLPPKARRKRRPTKAKWHRGFALAFTLHDVSSRPQVEAGVTRNLRLLREIHPRLTKAFPNESVDLLSLLQQATGLSIEAYFSLCFVTFALTNVHKFGAERGRILSGTGDGGVFNVAPERLRGEGSSVSLEDAARFLESVSLSPGAFADELAEAGQTPEATNFTVFRKYPVVRLEGGLYRVLDRSFLLDKLAGGFYWTLRAAAEALAPEGGRRNAVKRFNGWWGKLFEAYVDALFEHSASGRDYSRQPHLEGATSPDGACDGLINENRRALLLEYKMSSLALKPRHSLSSRRLAAEILGKFGRKGKGGKGVLQLASVAKEFLAGGRLENARADDTDAVYPALVCADTGMGSPMVNGLLQMRFKALAPTDARLRPLTVLTIEDLERMLSGGPDWPLSKMLDTWLEGDPQMTTYPWLVIRQRCFEGRRSQNSWVAEASEAWMREMMDILRLDDARRPIREAEEPRPFGATPETHGRD